MAYCRRQPRSDTIPIRSRLGPSRSWSRVAGLVEALLGVVGDLLVGPALRLVRHEHIVRRRWRRAPRVLVVARDLLGSQDGVVQLHVVEKALVVGVTRLQPPEGEVA